MGAWSVAILIFGLAVAACHFFLGFVIINCLGEMIICEVSVGSVIPLDNAENLVMSASVLMVCRRLSIAVSISSNFFT